MQAAGESPAVCSRFQSCDNRIFAAPRIRALGGFFFRHPMKRSTVIKSSSLPRRSPLGLAILFWLLLDRLGVPGWAFGVLWTLVGLLVLIWVISFKTESAQDVPGFGEK